MSNGCCCAPPGSNGGGIAAVAALVGIGIFIYLNIVAIITFLLLMVASVVGLAVIGVGGMLFLRRYIVPKWSNGRMLVRDGKVSYELGSAAADIMPHTALGRPQTIQMTAEVVDDGVLPKSLERGSQGRAGAIHARAREAALAPHVVQGQSERGADGRHEPGSLRHWLRGYVDPPDQDWN